MPDIRLTGALAAEYVQLYRSCEIRPQHLDRVESAADRVLVNAERYRAVATPLGIPWYFIAALHNLESSQSFERHLHNGDPLTSRTRRVPAGRPADGAPPFTWEGSADDALRMKRLHTATDWSLPALLFRMERYNGWGYRRYHQQVLSPYLWSSASHYLRGKYVADGSWSDTAVSRQVGGAALIRRLDERGAIDDLDQPAAPGPLFHLSEQAEDRVEDLQRFLNTFEGNRLLVDGVPGLRTSAAVEQLFGWALREGP